MKNLSCQERVKKEEILSHIALRQYFMQSLCHLNFTPYTVFETNVVACHITAEHSSKSLDWRQILFLFLLPMITKMVAAQSTEIKSCNPLLLHVWLISTNYIGKRPRGKECLLYRLFNLKIACMV